MAKEVSSFRWTETPNGPVLKLNGSLGFGVANSLLQSFQQLKCPGNRVEVRCESVEFISTAVLQVLISAGKTLAEQGKQLQVLSPSDELNRWAELGGWTGLFTREKK